MGRTNPTYRDTLRSLERQWGTYRKALRRQDQPHFDALFEQGREHADAAGLLNHPSPEITLLLSILVEHEKRLTRLETRIEDADDE